MDHTGSYHLVGILIYSSCKGTYNAMVTKSQDTQAKWAQVESQYQRRNDLYNSVVKVIRVRRNSNSKPCNVRTLEKPPIR
jgi:hypothetical protein